MISIASAAIAAGQRRSYISGPIRFIRESDAFAGGEDVGVVLSSSVIHLFPSPPGFDGIQRANLHSDLAASPGTLSHFDIRCV